MINVRNYKIFKSHLSSFFIVIFIISPLFNEAFIKLTTFNLNIIIFCLLLIYAFIVILESLIVTKRILTLHLLILLFIILIFNISQISYLENIHKFFYVYLGFFVALIVLLDDNISYTKQLLIKYFIVLLIFSIVISIDNFNNLITGFKTKSRMIYSSNPISISVLVSLLLIVIHFTTINKLLKYTISFLCVIILLILMTRSIIISLGVILLLYFITNKKYLLTIFIFICTLLLFLIINEIRGNQNIFERIELQSVALEYINQNILGYGLGYYNMISEFEYPHNIIVELSLETGIIFTFFYFFLIFIIILNLLIKSKIELFSVVFIFFNLILLFSFSSIDFMRILIPLLFLSLKEIDILKYK